MMLFSGSANLTLASKIAAALGLPLSPLAVGRFPDGECKVSIQSNVRGKDVCIIQPTSTPVNDHLIELALIVNALQRSGASRITAVVPYFGYARQDFSASKPGSSFSAQVIANFFNSMGIAQLITLDLHAAKLQEFFSCKVDNLSSLNVFLPDIQKKQLHNPAVVSPDIGGASRAAKFADTLNFELVVVQKLRNQLTFDANTIFGSVKNRDCILIDDIIDTGNTICSAADLLKTQGANKVYAYGTHAVLSQNALRNLYASAIDEIMLTDTIELRNINTSTNKIKQITTSQLFADHLQTQLNIMHKYA